MNKIYKTKAAAKAQATRQFNRYGDKLEVIGTEQDGWSLEPVVPTRSITTRIGSAKVF